MLDKTRSISVNSNEITSAVLPKGWSIVRASDFCLKVADGTHDTPKVSKDGRFLVTSKHIKDGKVDLRSAYKISQDDFDEINKRSRVDQWDVLVSMIGTVGEVSLVVDIPDYAIKNVGLFKCGDETRAKWLFYFLRSKLGQNEILRRTAGTTQSYITLGELRSFPVVVPGVDSEMHSIVGILSALDDKIELLREQNKTLEATAQTLFKEWFVNFNFPDSQGKPYKFSGGKMIDSELGPVPEGWRAGKISDLTLQLNSGGTPSTAETSYYNGTINWFSTKEFQDEFLFESEKKITEKGLAFSSAKIFPADTVVMAIYAAPTVGRLGILAIESSFNQAAVGLVAKVGVSYSYLYLLLKHLRFEFNNLANGAAQQNLNVGLVKNFPVVLPKEEIFQSTNSILESFMEKIKNNSTQIEALSKLRDMLLSKLLNGGVRFREFEVE